MMRFRPQHAIQGMGICALLLLAANLGCTRYSYVNPRNPGYAVDQRDRAMIEHDPYPDPNAGPEVMGGRPLGFQTPPPEAAWLQKRDALHRSPYAYPPKFTAQPIYPTPVYPPNGTVPSIPLNSTAPVYQPSFMPPQQGVPTQ